MKKYLGMMICLVSFRCVVSASTELPDNEVVVQETKETDTVASVQQETTTFYVTAKNAGIYKTPKEEGETVLTVQLGTMLQCGQTDENGWKSVALVINGEKQASGYMQERYLSETMPMQSCVQTVTVLEDYDVLDFPGKKDGEVIGEVLEFDEIVCTGIVNDVWSKVRFEDGDGEEQAGYVPLDILDGLEEIALEVESEEEDSVDTEIDAGVLKEGSGESIFTDALEGVIDTEVESTMANVESIRIGTPIAVPAEATLVPLGQFRITHYCPCSICCGPWANGITSTGVTAVTNHTIAVDPTQIPYGSLVVINGQVYVAEDCGGAIKTNCIDIYVGSHEEGESKGLYYTDVYLIQ